MESFLVYLFNFYYAISELEQNKQNNTIIFFLLFIFFNKKVDLSSLRGGGGVRAHPSHPPPPPYGPVSFVVLCIIMFYCKAIGLNFFGQLLMCCI